jgi:hypothetical protein
MSCTFVPFAQQLAFAADRNLLKVVLTLLLVGATLSPQDKRKRNHHDQPGSWPHIDRFVSASIFAFSGQALEQTTLNWKWGSSPPHFFRFTHNHTLMLLVF